MKVYVASKSGNQGFALDPENVIEVCAGGPDPLGDARSYAFNYTKAEDKPAFIYGVDLSSFGKYEVKKEVVYRLSPNA